MKINFNTVSVMFERNDARSLKQNQQNQQSQQNLKSGNENQGEGEITRQEKD